METRKSSVCSHLAVTEVPISVNPSFYSCAFSEHKTNGCLSFPNGKTGQKKLGIFINVIQLMMTLLWDLVVETEVPCTR